MPGPVRRLRHGNSVSVTSLPHWQYTRCRRQREPGRLQCHRDGGHSEACGAAVRYRDRRPGTMTVRHVTVTVTVSCRTGNTRSWPGPRVRALRPSPNRESRQSRCKARPCHWRRPRLPLTEAAAAAAQRPPTRTRTRFPGRSRAPPGQVTGPGHHESGPGLGADS